MVLLCIGKYNLASTPQLCRHSFLQLNRRSNLVKVEKLLFRKQLHYTAIKWTKNEGAHILRNKSNGYNIKRLFSLVGPEKYKMAAAVGLLVVSSSVTMSIPFAMGKVIDIIYSMDQLKTEHNLGKKPKNVTESLHLDLHRESIMRNLEKVCGILVGVFVIGALANFGRVYLMRMISQKVAGRIRNSLYSSIGYKQNYVE